jgi:hypothetical protein
MDKYFKKCGFCGKEWKELYEFLEDRDVIYQGLTEYEGIVVFFFIHRDCKTSLGLTAKQLGEHFKFIDEVYDKRPI